MKKKRPAPRPAPAFPRRRWEINPYTRIKDSAKRYTRARLRPQVIHDPD
ncbi:MAG TPA: hypothetical protein PKE47_15420 [Verrucomicrobiota bacterium]|nr:hypothetical protein [Verrucomicrobiota bacterium]